MFQQSSSTSQFNSIPLQVWCSAVTEETTNLQMEKDTHSPPKFRVVGSLANLNEFSKEFNCPLNSYMNPVQKCDLF